CVVMCESAKHAQRRVSYVLYQLLGFLVFLVFCYLFLFFIIPPPTPEIYTLSLHDALPILGKGGPSAGSCQRVSGMLYSPMGISRSEEHTSELQSLRHLVCRLQLEKKKERRNIRRRSVWS